MVNEKWEQQKEYVRNKLSEKETGNIYRQRKIDVEPVFGFLKANLGFTRIFCTRRVEGGKRHQLGTNGRKLKKVRGKIVRSYPIHGQII